MEGYWAIRKYKAGPIGETYKFWVPGKRPQRMTAAAKASIRKQAQNGANAVKTLARILNANFRAGDYLIGLDYDEKSYAKLVKQGEAFAVSPSGDAETSVEDARAEIVGAWYAARKELERGLRRVQYHAKKDGVEIRFAAITSDMDPDTGEIVRVHHHMVINREAKEYFEKHWCRGGVSWTQLSAQPDYTPVASYLLSQVRHVEDAKKYTTSRKNLIRPAPRDAIAKTAAIIRAPRGAVLLDAGKNIPGQAQYLRYILPDQVASADAIDRGRGVPVVRAVELHQRRERDVAAGCSGVLL